MSSKSKSVSPKRQTVVRRQQRPDRREDPDSHKCFLTNLNGDIQEKEVQDQVRRLFEKYGEVTKLSLKKHKNGFYYFGFLEFTKGFQAYEAVKALDQHSLFGKNMKVRQDRQSQGCFYCKRMGHFARQCPDNRRRPRSYSNDRISRERYDRRRDDRSDKYQRRDGNRDRDRYSRNDRHERDDQRDRDRHKHEKRRHRDRSYSASKQSSGSSHRRHEKKDKKRKEQRRRSRSRS